MQPQLDMESTILPNMLVGKLPFFFKILPKESEQISMAFFYNYVQSGYVPSILVLDASGKEIVNKSLKNKNGDGTYYCQTAVTLQKSQVYYIELFLGGRENIFSFSLCSKTLHPRNTHFVVTKHPSCTESGEQVSYCEFCGGISEIKEIPALGHTPGDWRTEAKATCALEGTKVRRCTICNIAVETETIPY